MSVGRTPHRITVILLAALILLAGVAVVLLARHDRESTSPSPNTIRRSGGAATATRKVPAFTAVDLAGVNHVAIHVGGKQHVVVHADHKLLRRVSTVVRNGKLVIGTTPGSFSTTTPMSVDVTVPSLDAVTLSGSGSVTVEGVRATQFRVDVPGTGVLRVSGRTDRLTARLGGSGDVRLEGLIAREATAVVAGSGRLQVRATGSLDATISGAGEISYSGNPSKVTQKITGAGSIMSGSAR